MQDILGKLTKESFVTGFTPFGAYVPHFSGTGLRVQPFVTSTNKISVSIPGSKSFTNRAIVLSGMCSTPTTLEGFLFSDDSFWGLYSLIKLGFRVELKKDEGRVIITPPSVKTASELTLQVPSLFFGMAGTLARFFPAVLLNFSKTFDAPKLSVLCDATPNLKKRPLDTLIIALKKLGANISATTLPFNTESSDLKGSTTISGKTSGQFLSGLLLAAAGSRNNIKITRIDNLVQPDYVRMTLASLESFGAKIEYNTELQEFRVQPSLLSSPNYAIEADASTACYFITFAVLHNINLKITNLGSRSLQPDLKFVNFLKDLGAEIEVNEESVDVKSRARSKLKGGKIFSFKEYSDQAITAAVVALFADDAIEIRDIEHIRGHESDRISGLCENLTAAGVQVEEFKDGFKVTPNQKKLAGPWKTFHDHRFVMSGFLVASLNEHVEVLEPGWVSKTAPNFFQLFEELGVKFK